MEIFIYLLTQIYVHRDTVTNDFEYYGYVVVIMINLITTNSPGMMVEKVWILFCMNERASINMKPDIYMKAVLTALLISTATRAPGSTTSHIRVQPLGAHSLKNN